MFFVARSEEENARAVQEAISALMKRHVAEIRDAIEAAAKEERAGFTKAVNATVEEAVLKVRVKSEPCRRKDAKEAVRVAKDNNCRRRALVEE